MKTLEWTRAIVLVRIKSQTSPFTRTEPSLSSPCLKKSSGGARGHIGGIGE